MLENEVEHSEGDFVSTQMRFKGSHSNAWAEPTLASSKVSWPRNFENHNSMDTLSPVSPSVKGMRMFGEDGLSF